MSIAIIFTYDYEVFGDGTGSTYREQILPTADLLNIFDLYGAKLTIFFEYGQYTGYKKAGLSRDIELMESQLVDAIGRGHDVQLHYHPTWFNASYVDGKFSLDQKAYDISFFAESAIEAILKEGKEYLENLLKPVLPDYECICYRAGAWSMQQAWKVIPILRKLGFRADSSVAPGACFASEYGCFDYVGAPHSYRPWKIGADLIVPDPCSDFLEIPIYTRRNPLAFLKYLNHRYKSSKSLHSMFYKTKVSEKSLGVVGKLLKVFSRNYYMADFNSLSINDLVEMTLGACRENRGDRTLHPLVFIGHSKFSYYNEDLIHFFERIRSSGEDIVYLGLADFVRKVMPS